MNDRPLKSVHITNYYHAHSGGVKTSYDKLLEAANMHKRFVRLIVPGEKTETVEINDYGRIYYVEAKPFPFFDRRYRVIMPSAYIRNDTPIRNILLAEKPDMIEIYDNYALSLLAGIVRTGYFKELDRPMLVYFTGERMDNLFASYVSKGRLGKWFSRRVIGNYNFPMFDFHIANSPYVAEEFYESVRKSDNPWRYDRFFNFCWRRFQAATLPFEDTIAICPRGVNAERFSPARRSADFERQMKRKAGIPENSTVLFYAGRISPDKNVRLLPDLMEILARDERRDFRLLIAGAGPLSRWLEEETVRRVPNKIVQIGHLDAETLARTYANADVFVHPNPREPFGNVVLEAMASGVPVLVPNAGGLLLYANHENAWLVEVAAESFAAAVLEIMENEQSRQQKIAAALETARANTQGLSIKCLFDTYDRMYVDFQARNLLFTDRETSKNFDFAKSVKQFERRVLSVVHNFRRVSTN